MKPETRQLLRQLYNTMKPYKGLLALGFLFMVLQNIGLIKIPEMMKLILDELTSNNERSTILSLIARTIAYVALTGFCMYVMRNSIIGVSRKVEYDIRKAFFATCMRVELGFYDTRQTGDLVSRATHDLNNVRTLVGPGTMYIPNSLSRLALFLPVMGLLNGKLLLCVALQFAFLILIIVFVLPKFRPMYKRVQEQVARINNHAWQLLSGITTIKTHSLEATETARAEHLSKEYLRRNMRLAVTEEFMWPFFIFVFSVSEVIMLWVGGLAVIKGEMTIGELLQFNIMLGVLVFPILSLGWVMSLTQQGLSAMERLNEVLHVDLPAEPQKKLPTNKAIDVEVRALNYSYPNQTSPALRSINLSIPWGKTIGITGRTGSGKSTLIGLLSGVLRPPPNSIFYGGIDITELSPNSLYERIRVVPQETFLFSTSIKNNIGFSAVREAQEPKVIRAARQADFEKDVLQFQERYEQRIGERGITLSGGQKQRTALARAIYKKGFILVFDDSLSSVDSETEANILENIRSMKGGQTILLVSHRVSALRLADEIVVLKNGAISERGPHKELINKKGDYAHIARIQELRRGLKEVAS